MHASRSAVSGGRKAVSHYNNLPEQSFAATNCGRKSKDFIAVTRLRQNDVAYLGGGSNRTERYHRVVMAEGDADRFRKQSEECRRRARLARSQPDKEAWLRLARDWSELARGAELNEDIRAHRLDRS